MSATMPLIIASTGPPNDASTAKARIHRNNRGQARSPRYLQSLDLVVLVAEMTSQQIADEALALWRANKNSPEIEALIEEFFRFPTSNEFERQQSCVTEIITAPQPMFLSDLPERLSEAF